LSKTLHSTIISAISPSNTSPRHNRKGGAPRRFFNEKGIFLLLPLASELLAAFTNELERHQKHWELNRPAKITFTFINGDHPRKPVKKIIILSSSEIDLRESSDR
jgi:hypothetical protein